MPTQAREALRRVRELVEADRDRGLSVHLETTRLGLEGETRVCVDYKDPGPGTRAYERAGAIVKGVDLVNLVAEPCASPTPRAGNQKEEEEP